MDDNMRIMDDNMVKWGTGSPKKCLQGKMFLKNEKKFVYRDSDNWLNVDKKQNKKHNPPPTPPPNK